MREEIREKLRRNCSEGGVNMIIGNFEDWKEMYIFKADHFNSDKKCYPF
jgi:hypothetical protein